MFQDMECRLQACNDSWKGYIHLTIGIGYFLTDFVHSYCNVLLSPTQGNQVTFFMLELCSEIWNNSYSPRAQQCIPIAQIEPKCLVVDLR